MATVLINYNLNATTIKNTDGSYNATVTNCKVVNGPGATPYGTFTNVLEFAAGSKLSTAVQAGAVNNKQFSATIVFKPSSASAGLQTLVDCSALPFSIWVQPASMAPAAVGIQVKSSQHGNAVTDTFLRTTDLNMQGWNKLDLIYDNDLLALVLNNKLVGVTGLPNGLLAPAFGTALVLGQSVIGTLQFLGQMASFTFTKGIPVNLYALIADARTYPEWLISRKYMEVKDKYSFGAVASAVAFDAAIPAYTKRWSGGTIIAPIGAGAAFEVHGLIYAAYKADASLKGKLGVPLSDEISAGVGGGRKNLFTQGAIYFSDASGAVPVFGAMYADYEALGGPAHVIGFPTKAEVAVAGGKMQEFQRGHMYFQDGGGAAFEVHGLILEEFKRLGGLAHCGYPIMNESGAVNAGGVEVARVSMFANGSIFYNPSIGACEVRYPILTAYLRAGGINSQLGLPTSDELAVPGLPGAKATTFQRGCIIHFNGKTKVILPFNIYVGTVDTKENEGDGGQNDLMIRMIIKEGDVEVFSRRWPESGYINEKNIVDLKVTAGLYFPNNLTKTFTLSVHCVDYDDGLSFGNDDLGTFTTTLNAANGWGWFNAEDGIFDSGKVSLINNIRWAVQAELSPNYVPDFWNVKNAGQGDLTLQQGAIAIRDIDSAPEKLDPFDKIDQAFFNGVIKRAGKKGNCYGLSTYALRAWNGQAVHSPPLQKHADTPVLWEEFRIQHARQYGDMAIGWTLDEFMANRTQNPKEVFLRSRNASQKGNHPVLSLQSEANLLKAKGHCVLPQRWDDSGAIWKITVFDPNKKNETQEFLIDPVKNTWSYPALGWSGGFKTGGRLFYLPGSIVMPRPRTPYWALLGRIPNLVVYFVSDLLSTVFLSDDQGTSLSVSDLADPNPVNTLKKFMAFFGMGDDGGFTGGLFMRPTGATLTAATLQALAATTMPKWSTIDLGDSFVHSMIGKGMGNENVSLGMTHHLTQLLLEGKIDPGETLSFGAKNFNSPERLITLKTGKARTYSLKTSTHFGIQGDNLAIEFAFPTKANTDAKILLDASMTRIDLLTTGTAMPTVITVSGKIGGTLYNRVIDATIEGGTRLNFHNILQTGIVTGGRIDCLKGSLTKDFTLNAR